MNLGRTLSLGVAGALLLAPTAGAAVDFATQIAPLLAENCTDCHGPDKQKSALRLDSPEAILRGGDSGEPALVPGNAKGSHLIQLVTGMGTDPKRKVMPPKGDRLGDDEVALLRQWIDEGAKMPGVDPSAAPKLTTDHWSFQKLPTTVTPPAIASPWIANPIDAYVLAAQRDRKLSPSKRERRAGLVRRLYLVMHGLPPTPEQVAAYIDAPAGKDNWEQIVDSVLASPRYGERWARHWLDIVRYGETNGFETNRERLTAYHYRDWVIDAFNEDKRYDQFVREQIAGDALGAHLGTGFLVAGTYDIVKSPDINLTLMQRQDELADMINTTGTAFLGLTLGCARCHNHKFDPILQKDYYAMQAVFAGVTHGERAVPAKNDEAGRARIAAMKKTLAEDVAHLEKLRTLAEAEGRFTESLRPPVDPAGNVESFKPVAAKFVRFEIKATNASEACVDELRVFSTEGKNVALASEGAVPKSSGNFQNNQHPFHKLEFVNDGKIGNQRSWIGNPGACWVQVEFAKTHAIERIEWARDREKKFRDRTATDYRFAVSKDGVDWRPVASSADRRPFTGAANPRAFLAELDETSRATAERLLDSTQRLRAQISTIENGPKAWIGTFAQPGATHRLYRGDPMAKREVVAPDALTVLGSLGMKTDTPEQQRRVKVAEWIASPDNPLTARVLVNRIWQFHFGTGLVDTPSDLGANGTLPTHPELLDWLAREFIDGGWSIKKLQRTILLSNTWRQSSRPDARKAAIDADSRYLWRFPPQRLSAEAIRDSILHASGVLDLRMGGLGFYLHDVDRENVVHYHAKTKTGPPEWRRMVYLFKIRQEQDAVFGAFDCPDGNQVIPKRSRSTTPLQALNLFNSDFVIQQSELLAKRLQKDASDTKSQIRRAFEILYNRAPEADETEDSEKFVAREGMKAFCRALYNTNEFLFLF